MAKFRVELCCTSYDYYQAVIEADSQAEAERKAIAAWESDGGVQFEHVNEDGGGLDVTSCEED
jgi:hypothetical protein